MSDTQRARQTSSRRQFLTASAAAAVASAAPTLASAQGASLPQAGTLPPATHATPAVVRGQRTLGAGRVALPVSALGFGMMGMNYNRGPHPDRPALIRLLHQAVDRGVTLFDTAEVYGPHINETLAGEALSPFRDRIAVTTKFGHRIIDGKYIAGELDSRPATIRRVAEESLKRLRLEAISLFYQHRLDPAVPIEEVAGTVSDLIGEGKVQRFGLCEVGVDTIRRAHAVQPVTAVQSEYHLMWRDPEAQVMPVLAELGISLVPYSPLNRGFLGGDITEYTRFDSGNDNRNTLPRFAPQALRANLRVVEALNRFGRPRGMTGAQVALAWLLAKGPTVVPIPGTTTLSHLEENLRTTDFTFSAAEVSALEHEISAITFVGDRYPPEQQAQIAR